MISLQKISILALCLSPAMTIQAADAPTNEDLHYVRALAAPHLSPDGGSVLLHKTDSARQKIVKFISENFTGQ